jgi:hypothetical protein
MAKNAIWISRKVLGDSVFPFSNLDSAWSNYKNSPIFNQDQNTKFKYVLQCYKISNRTYLPSVQNWYQMQEVLYIVKLCIYYLIIGSFF